MKLSAFSPESVGDGFLAVREQMSAADFLAALLVSLAAAAAAPRATTSAASAKR